MSYIVLLLIFLNAPKAFAFEPIFNLWQKGRFDQAIGLCIDLDQKLLAKTIRASRLLDPGYKGHYCSAAMDFLRKNPMWIQRTAIIKKGESLMHRWSSADVVAWCAKYPPISGKAHRICAIASVKEYGITQETICLIRKGWIYGSFSQNELQEYLIRYGNHLNFQTHQERLSTLILEENIAGIKSLLPLLDEFQRKKATDCILFLQKDKKSLEIFSSYDQSYIDKDLIYAFFKSHKDGILIQLKALILLFDSLCKLGPDLEHSVYWSGLRDVLAREFITHKDYVRAYTIINDFINGNQFLAGWILLSFLNKPEPALTHFLQGMQFAKSSHIYSKGYYLIGKSFIRLGRRKEANKAFSRAAVFYNTFYGQLSLTSLGKKKFAFLNSNIKKIPLKNNVEMLEVVNLLKQHERYDVARPMCKVLFSKLTSREIVYALDLLSLPKHCPNASYWNCTIGELAAERGVFVTKYLYPQLVNLPNGFEEKALVHGVVKQESGFNAKARSQTNAQGLMQILPSTAIIVAKTYTKDSDQINLFDSKVNLNIGGLYVKDLLRRYRGNYVLTLAAYNAGPSKVYQWKKNHGNLGESSTVFDVVEWIEKIPFIATRRYVQGVIASSSVYKALLNGDKDPCLLTGLEQFQQSLYLKIPKKGAVGKKR